MRLRALPAAAFLVLAFLLAAALLRSPTALEAPAGSALGAPSPPAAAPLADPGPPAAPLGIARIVTEEHPDFARELAEVIAGELAPGVVRRGEPLDDQAREQGLSLGRPPLERVPGIVVNDLGEPVRFARVSAREQSLGEWAAGDFRLKTDERGVFALPAPPGEGWKLKPSAPGYSEHFSKPLLWRSGDPPPRLVLERPGIIRGRIAFEEFRDGGDERPVSYCLERKGWDWPLCQSHRNSNRAFRFLVPAGPYVLTIGARGAARGGPLEVRLDPGEDRDLGTIVLGAGGTLRVTVRGPDGGPPGPVTVVAVPIASNHMTAWSEMRPRLGHEEDSATFEFQVPPEEEFEIRVLPHRYPSSVHPVGAVRRSEVKLVELRSPRGGDLPLRVLDPDGRPVDSCGVQLRDDDDFHGPHGLAVYSGSSGLMMFGRQTWVTDAQGRILLKARRTGRWELSGTREGKRFQHGFDLGDGPLTWVRLGQVEVREGENPEVVLTWPEGR
ncbi:MAG: carboxypeptidase-like regulatory domain-containing protein [Planctomycetales bacterium]|nr:carboxypeptidase-like regulatory domain-containing protein [Planctomycetales bacterium]